MDTSTVAHCHSYSSLIIDVAWWLWWRCRFWRPNAVDGFSVLGHIAERSHLENPSTYAVLVKEVGMDVEDEVPILVPPSSFMLVWADVGCNSEFGEVGIWKPVPPNENYVALGCVVTTSHQVPPSFDSVRCVHRDFAKPVKVHRIPPASGSGGSNADATPGFLWSSQGTSAGIDCSVWLVEPSFDCILPNSFLISASNEAPPDSDAYCLRLAVENSL